MMIGKGNETSASFVNYQLQRQSGQDDNDVANVNDAVRRKTIGELARDASDVSGKNVFDTDAYQVDISDRAKNWLTFATGSTAQISLSVDFGAGWTREDELAALEKSIGQYQRMNENYRRTGSPVDPLEEQKRLERITSQFPAENVAASAAGFFQRAEDIRGLRERHGSRADVHARDGNPLAALSLDGSSRN